MITVAILIIPVCGFLIGFAAGTIKELKQLGEQEPCEDIVSKQDCINAIENTDCELSPQAWKEITTSIMSLPPVTPARKKGKWIKNR